MSSEENTKIKENKEVQTVRETREDRKKAPAAEALAPDPAHLAAMKAGLCSRVILHPALSAFFCSSSFLC